MVWNIRSLELSFPGTFAPGSKSSKNFLSKELSLPGTFLEFQELLLPRYSFMDRPMYAYAVASQF